MRIGVIGCGKIGATAARLFAAASHEVAIANSRGPGSLTGLVEELGDGVRAATVEGAPGFGDVVLVAIPFGRYHELPPEPFANTIVVDATNYFPQRDGNLPELDEDRTTSSELLATHLSDGRVVKAFNTMNWAVLRDRAAPDEGEGLFVAGDDPDAKERVSGLIEEIGFAPVDTGSLAEGGRRQQTGSPVFTRLIAARDAKEALAAYG